MAGKGGSNDGWYGQNDESSDTSVFNHQHFTAELITRLMSTATIAKVEKFTAHGSQGGGGQAGQGNQSGKGGQVAPIGMVNVTPLVNMIDGINKSQKHGVVNNLPYFRLQSGKQAIIMDPQPGDLVMVVFADRDISAVKKNYKQSNPGSRRRNDFADGMAIGVILSKDAPTSFIQFDNNGKIIISPDNGTTKIVLEANKITAQVSNLKIVITDKRIDLGKENAPFKVITDGGPSNKVFAIID